MADFSYTTDGLYVTVLPNNESAVVAWNQLATHTDNTGKVLLSHFPALKAALKAAGYTISKRRAARIDADELLAELLA